MEESLENKIEEWKVVRSTVVEFDHILSNIRSLDITVTTVLLGAAFEYSDFIFLLVPPFNICLLFLEYHYHIYLNEIANYAKELEEAIDFKLTIKLSSARDKYKEEDGKIAYVKGYFVANVYYWIYSIYIYWNCLIYTKSLQHHSEAS